MQLVPQNVVFGLKIKTTYEKLSSTRCRTIYLMSNSDIFLNEILQIIIIVIN